MSITVGLDTEGNFGRGHKAAAVKLFGTPIVNELLRLLPQLDDNHHDIAGGELTIAEIAGRLRLPVPGPKVPVTS